MLLLICRSSDLLHKPKSGSRSQGHCESARIDLFVSRAFFLHQFLLSSAGSFLHEVVPVPGSLSYRFEKQHKSSSRLIFKSQKIIISNPHVLDRSISNIYKTRSKQFGHARHVESASPVPLSAKGGHRYVSPSRSHMHEPRFSSCKQQRTSQHPR